MPDAETNQDDLRAALVEIDGIGTARADEILDVLSTYGHDPGEGGGPPGDDDTAAELKHAYETADDAGAVLGADKSRAFKIAYARRALDRIRERADGAANSEGGPNE